jgi:hypothetical protein
MHIDAGVPRTMESIAFPNRLPEKQWTTHYGFRSHFSTILHGDGRAGKWVLASCFALAYGYGFM